jgi:hypothetical protein
VVHGIIQALKGVVEVDSRSGNGTTFRILLPCVVSGDEPTVIWPKPLSTGNERILLTDDEDGLAEAVRSALDGAEAHG